jgi:hypothetical protein
VTPNRKNVLMLLKAELQFVEEGGYRRSARSPWRSPYVFEESPSCPNHNDRARQHRCADCWLMSFVQPDLRDEQVPCRFVQLTSDGTTVDSLYRHARLPETEEILGTWLRRRIREIDAEISEGSCLPFACNQ